MTDDAPSQSAATFLQRRQLADHIFRGALLFNVVLTVFWLVSVLTGIRTALFSGYGIHRESLIRVAKGILFLCDLGLRLVRDQERAAGLGLRVSARRSGVRSSRRVCRRRSMSPPTWRHSERRIRILDMIGRRGRFITLGMAGFFYLYSHVRDSQTPAFATLSCRRTCSMRW